MAPRSEPSSGCGLWAGSNPPTAWFQLMTCLLFLWVFLKWCEAIIQGYANDPHATNLITKVRRQFQISPSMIAQKTQGRGCRRGPRA